LVCSSISGRPATRTTPLAMQTLAVVQVDIAPLAAAELAAARPQDHGQGKT
jgi:hypothetical protein